MEISPEVVDCIVFWNKNPEPMMERLEELSAYQYYFQFTLTGYGKDIESNVPHKKEVMIPVFQRLSEKIGAQKVIWRYDPILFAKTYTPEYHLKAFKQIAVRNGMLIASCAEDMDLTQCGIEHNSCIDKRLIEEIIGCEINVHKDKGQRPECGCVESVEVGTYDTCRNGCKYCYANYSRESVLENCKKYNPDSPILCGSISAEDRISDRKLRSFKEKQMRLFE